MALCCNPLSGNVSKVCGAKKGGLIRLYATNLCQIDDVVLASGEVTTITMKTDPLTTNPYYFYQLGVKKNSAGFANTAEIGDNNRFWSQSVSFVIEGFDSETKAAFQSMIDGDAVFIGTTSDGISNILGRISGAEMTEGTLGTGIQNSDLFGGTATFIATELEVTPTIAAGTTISVLNEDGVTVDVVTL